MSKAKREQRRRFAKNLLEHGRGDCAGGIELADPAVEAFHLIGEHHAADRQAHGQWNLERVALDLAGYRIDDNERRPLVIGARR